MIQPLEDNTSEVLIRTKEGKWRAVAMCIWSCTYVFESLINRTVVFIDIGNIHVRLQLSNRDLGLHTNASSVDDSRLMT